MSTLKDAASLIVIKKIKSNLYILMGKRPPKQVFMPDIFVFPGGRVEKSDGYMESFSELTNGVSNILTRHCTAHRARAIALASIRETYEETGLMIGKTHEEFKSISSKNWKDFQNKKVKPRLDVLSLIARAITPKGQARRYNARFFAVDAIHSHGKITKNDELLEIDWYPIEYIKNNLPLAQVTELVLNQIEIIFKNYNNINFINEIPIYSRRKGKRVIRFEK